MDDNILLAEEGAGLHVDSEPARVVMNSLNFPLLHALCDQIEAVRFRSDIRVVIITGSGKRLFVPVLT